MKCRKNHLDENGKQTLVWFGSYGKNQDGTAKFYNEKDKHDNYSNMQEGVRDSLIQRLSVIKGELWYKASYGLPLMDKVRNKGIYDSVIISIINSHPDVKNIVYFNSEMIGHEYKMNFIVNTIYNEEVEITTLL